MRHPIPPPPTNGLPRLSKRRDTSFPAGIFFTEPASLSRRRRHPSNKENVNPWDDDAARHLPRYQQQQQHLPAGLLEDDGATSSSDGSPPRPSPASSTSRRPTVPKPSLRLALDNLAGRRSTPIRAPGKVLQSSHQAPADVVSTPIAAPARTAARLPSPSPPSFSPASDPHFVPFAYLGNGVLCPSSGIAQPSLFPRAPPPPPLRSPGRPHAPASGPPTRRPLPTLQPAFPPALARPSPHVVSALSPALIPAPVVRLDALSPRPALPPPPGLLPPAAHPTFPLPPRPASAAQTEKISYSSGNSGRPCLPQLAVVGREVETTARSGFFLKECQRIARDFVACAEIVRIESVSDHAAALETLVQLGELHAEILRKLSLGDFEQVREVFAALKDDSPSPPNKTSEMARSDSASTISVPALSTSSSLSQLDSFASPSPARSHGSAAQTVDTAATSQAASSSPPPTPSSPEVAEDDAVRPLAVTANRWVSHTVCSAKFGGPADSTVLSARNARRFFHLLLNRITLATTVVYSATLTRFVVKTLADPKTHGLAPLELFVDAALRHVTTVCAGQEAARRLSQNVAWLMLDVHGTAAERGKPSRVPDLLRAAVQPSLDALVDKVFPPLVPPPTRANKATYAEQRCRPTDPRADRLSADLPALAVFLCFCHFFSASLVPSALLHELLHLLLHTPAPTDKECFAACEVFELAGQRLEQEGPGGYAKMEAAWARMKVVASKPGIGTRARFALQDVIDLKAHGWMSRSWMRSLRGLVQY